ncbi:MAG: manganese efflux pump [Candidatus Omnitrophica bacterium]|nr:manganese efflux pump [Candidatus Omnitrophota bacterium]
MSFLVIFATAVGLAMDAFAVALAAGAVGSVRTADALRIGGSFGFFQMMMPLAGWVLGTQLKHVIAAFDHWVAFGLLVFIGLKMIHEFFSSSDCERSPQAMTARRLFFLSVATSIDALAVGVSFAVLDYPVLWAAVIIGIVTFIIATAGVLIGRVCCCVWGRRAELAGGIILILIGSKILWDHLH